MGAPPGTAAGTEELCSPRRPRRGNGEIGSEERIGIWRAMQNLAGSGLSKPELTSALTELEISAPGQDIPMRYGDLPGMESAHWRVWAISLSQV